VANYTKEEIESFNAKDKRIVKQAILKKLIDKLDMEDVCEPENMLFPLTDRYVNYVYNGVSSGGAITTPEQTDWDKLSKSLDLHLPTGIEVKMLNLIVDGYKNSTGENVNPSDVIKLVIERFGTYPTKQASVEKVINILKG
jgi:hypothetical protein